MNYIQLINQYWQLREQGMLTAPEGDLYLYLIHTSNKLGWKNPFNQSNKVICAYLDMSEKSLIKYRNNLKNVGLINFESGQNKRVNTNYCIIYSQSGSQSGNQSGNQSGSLMGNQSGKIVQTTLNNKQNKTKQEIIDTPDSSENFVSNNLINSENKINTKKEKEKNSAEKEKLDYPFASEAFQETWGKLVQMPKWKNKTPNSLQMALDKLAAYDEGFAIQLIENSIIGSYQGVVFPSTPADYRKWKQTNETNIHTPTSKQSIYGRNAQTIQQAKEKLRERHGLTNTSTQDPIECTGFEDISST